MPSNDSAKLTIISLVYGYPIEAIKELEAAINAYNQVKEKDGKAIYPVLYPEGDTE